uniref:Uncharacterized protein n=1 Tax=Spironucleus salmonicida TaxID=348837 RepID=V6M524_9EUKA|eukprot:EST48459.1 Hypothetical protein SS50377_11408 [Spironucleus salmonicida]
MYVYNQVSRLQQIIISQTIQWKYRHTSMETQNRNYCKYGTPNLARTDLLQSLNTAIRLIADLDTTMELIEIRTCHIQNLISAENTQNSKRATNCVTICAYQQQFIRPWYETQLGGDGIAKIIIGNLVMVEAIYGSLILIQLKNSKTVASQSYSYYFLIKKQNKT